MTPAIFDRMRGGKREGGRDTEKESEKCRLERREFSFREEEKKKEGEKKKREKQRAC